MEESKSEARTSLEQVAVAAGKAWANWWSEELRREGRPMAGGWPGTLSEARARIAATLGPQRVLSKPELEALAKTAYLAAKTTWLASSTRDLDT